jgi:hypothetical protein
MLANVVEGFSQFEATFEVLGVGLYDSSIDPEEDVLSENAKLCFCLPCYNSCTPSGSKKTGYRLDENNLSVAPVSPGT